MLLPLVLALASANPMRALDPHKQIGQYGHDTWTSQRGLPGESVYQVLQSSDGYLWVRTGSGLARFDGVRFVPMDAAIGSERVKAICMGADGDLLIRTATRTVVYRNGQFSDYLPRSRWPGGDIRTLFESREHVLFIGADDYIYQVRKNGEVTALRSGTGWINAIIEDHAGTVWIAGSAALFSFAQGKLSPPFPTTAIAYTVTSLVEDHAQRLLAGTSKGLFLLGPHGPTLTPIQQTGMPALLTATLEDRQGNLWFGTEAAGVTRLSAGLVSSLGFATGLSDNTVLTLFEDREGSLWIGTSSGLDRLRNTNLTTFTTNEGLASNRVRSVIVDRDGMLDVFSDSGGLTRIRHRVAVPFPHNNQMPLSGSALFQSRDGSIWIGTYKGLSRIRDGKVTIFDGGGHFSRFYTSAISEDEESLIVTNSESRTFRLRDGKVTPFTLGGRETPVTKGVYTFSIYADPAHTLWFAAYGLYRIPLPGAAASPLPAGLQPGLDFDVTSILDDHAGNLWLGGRTRGLTQFRKSDGRISHFTLRDGLFDGEISSVLQGDDGRLWMSTEDGIYSVSLQALNDLADGRIQHLASTAYGLPDGMKTSAATETASQPSGARTPDGVLWFATPRGVVSVDPGHLILNSHMPPVIVESVLTDGALRPHDQNLNIAPGLKDLEIHYTSPSLLVPERVTFKYQLEGYDKKWVDAGSRRVAYYMNLPPGTYRFHVIAANDDGLWNEKGASFTLRLRPHFYQTRWFMGVVILFAGAAVLAGNMRYTRVMRHRAAQLTRVVDQRTSELRKSQRELELLANFDALTALPNRRMFAMDFARMCTRSKQQRFFLLLIDFDRFKYINDTYGHDAGDAFLVEAARRLQGSVRPSDRVARLGGDEFAVLLAGDPDDVGLEAICSRIVQSFAAPLLFQGNNIMTSASIGISIFPQHGVNQEQLYKCADLALYQAKRLGRNNWQCYRAEMKDAVRSDVDAKLAGITLG